MEKDSRYFNFPVQLLEGFLVEGRYQDILHDILYYSIYAHTQILDSSCDLETRIKDSANFFHDNFYDNYSQLKRRGNELFEKNQCKVMVGISTEKYWQFRNEEKFEFEKVCLLGFLALKSIVQNKSYCKLDNKFWLARMDGKVKSCEFTELSEEIRQYGIDYRLRKIKNSLRDWGLVTYSRYTRGFYISFSMNLEDLIFEAEKRRKSLKDKQYKKFEKSSLEKALLRLDNININATMSQPIKKEYVGDFS